ncbi:hypothetical protein HMN09_00399200 [Mycena chlorophos]|uniref:Uncharacterized protein n=1 Tax=Mycena chlorophos TaxID=658473 RepID=A0A8H6WFD5_MYCCL|nr:hypothetical protein HMN09_00399200 [Mycena chlorophos]
MPSSEPTRQPTTQLGRVAMRASASGRDCWGSEVPFANARPATTTNPPRARTRHMSYNTNPFVALRVELA